jgi:hypothetical protein
MRKKSQEIPFLL